DHSEGHGTIGLIRNRLTHDVLVHDTPVDLLFEPEQKKIHIPGTKNEETRDWARKIVGGEGGSSYGHRSEVAGALIEKYLRINGPKEWRVVYPDEQTQIITN
ncbi:hypothetical protein KY339_02670, partial [Candidatus Woesearchaeota archaeon]|nr:hypothetical protein [Candidatus Woesearchaeota archaeon]